MKLILLVFAAIVGTALAGCCKGKTARLVQQQWSSIWTAEKSHNKVTIARAVFDDLFNGHPGAKDFFKRVNVDDMDSPEFRAHCVRVMGGLDISMNLLHDKEALNAQLAHLSHQHQERDGITSGHFGLIVESFLRVLPQAVPSFNHDAWAVCLDVITGGITYGLP
jgi:hemoglobin-like flavoprotein